MNDSSGAGPRRYSNEELERILSRAPEIEQAQEGRITEDLLKEIAAEVGISREAVEQALTEARGKPHSVSSSNLVNNTGQAAGMGFVLGLITAAVRPLLEVGTVHVESLIALAILSVVLLLSAVRSRGPDAQTRYQSTSVALWLAFAVGFLLVYGTVWDDMLFVSACGALVSAVVGGAIVKINSYRSPPMLPPSPEAETFPVALTRYARLKRWFERLLQFTQRELPPISLHTVLGATS